MRVKHWMRLLAAMLTYAVGASHAMIYEGIDYSYDAVSACCVPESSSVRRAMTMADHLDLRMRDHRENSPNWARESKLLTPTLSTESKFGSFGLMHQAGETKEIKPQKERHMSQSDAEAKSASLPAWWSVTEAMTISVTVLVFGLIISLVIGYLIAKGNPAEQLLRTFGTILIIISAVFLVVAGYSDQQIAPVVGLLGTIAGYLLGRSSTNPTSS